MNVSKIKNLFYVFYWYASYFRSRNKFLGRFKTFSLARLNVGEGYASSELLHKIINVNRLVLSGHIVQERDGVKLAVFENSIQINFYLLLEQALLNTNRVSVLDFGGGLGTTYRQFKFFTKQKVFWTIVEQHQLVAEGIANFSSEELTFTCEIPKTNYDVVLFSAVLDFVEDPYAILVEVSSKISPNLIIVDRSLFHCGPEDFYTLKATAKHITNGNKYPVAWFSKERFVSRMEALGYNKVDEWKTPDGQVVNRASVGVYRGFAFRKFDKSKHEVS